MSLHEYASAPAVLSAHADERVRPFGERDLEPVAALFLRTFRKRPGAAQAAISEALVEHMRQVFLEGPAFDADCGSQVHVAPNGDIDGFIGIIQSSYTFQGAQLKAGAIGALMADAGSGAGLQMVRVVRNGPIDLLFTDSANRTSATIGQALKFELLALDSLDWTLVLSPARLAVNQLRQRLPRFPIGTMAPFARVADLGLGRIIASKTKRVSSPRYQDTAVDAATFASLAPQFVNTFRLRPTWNPAEMHWLLQQAEQKRGSGPLHYHVVADGSGEAVGCYAFYGQRGGVAHTLHLLGHERRIATVFDCLVQFAGTMGCVGICGVARMPIMPRLYTYPNIFFRCASTTMARSRHAAVRDAIVSGEMMVGGLAGDRWTRLASGDF